MHVARAREWDSLRKWFGGTSLLRTPEGTLDASK